MSGMGLAVDPGQLRPQRSIVDYCDTATLRSRIQRKDFHGNMILIVWIDPNVAMLGLLMVDRFRLRIAGYGIPVSDFCHLFSIICFLTSVFCFLTSG